jgi:hypothetical protein
VSSSNTLAARRVRRAASRVSVESAAGRGDRKGAGKSLECNVADSGTEDKYQDYRTRNNLAVRKCRAARKEKMGSLAAENEALKRELEAMRAVLVAKDAEIAAYKGLLKSKL